MNLPLRQSIGWDGWELAKVPGRAPSMPYAHAHAPPVARPPSGLTGPSQSISLSGAPCAWAKPGWPGGTT